jgi:hypothetical protein
VTFHLPCSLPPPEQNAQRQCGEKNAPLTKRSRTPSRQDQGINGRAVETKNDDFHHHGGSSMKVAL